MLLLTIHDGSTRIVHRRVNGFVYLHPRGDEHPWLAWSDAPTDTLAVASPDGTTLARLSPGETVNIAGLCLSVHRASDDATDRIEVLARKCPALTLGLPDGRRMGISERPVILGTHPDCDLVLTDPAVSARHCEVVPHRGGWIARDLGSTNGVWLSGARVAAAVLTPGVALTLGRTRVMCMSEDLPGKDLGASAIVGRSEGVRALRATLERIAPAPYAVLIEGESGSGKELVAREIHARSTRKDGPLVAVNCGAVAPSLIESELFGHERGAFTGASARRRGVFEEAHGGTLFLDEVGELPMAVQPALLRVLETGEIRRVGAEGARKVSVRVVAATLRDLEARVRQGSFREDLYFRLADFRVEVPPLRARRSDIPLLADHVLARIEAETGLTRVLEDRAVGELMAYDWPGNVRELASVLKRAAYLSDGVPIGPEHLWHLSRKHTPLRGHSNTLHPDGDLPEESQEPWPDGVGRDDIPALFAFCKGNVSRAARMLGIARSTFRDRLARSQDLASTAIDPLPEMPRLTSVR